MPSIINAATSGGLISTADTSGELRLQTASTTALTITSAQNVGIGTTSPVNPFVVSNGGAGGFEVATASNNISVNSYNRSSSAWTDLTYNANQQIFNSGGTTERMRITSTGLVGIGTSSPNGAVTISTQINALSGTSNTFGLHLYPAPSGTCYVDALTNSSSNSSLALRSYNNGTYYELRLNQNGNLALPGGAGGVTGTGITFPATQSASSDANTLDDYEEGTWTPTLAGSVSDPTGVTYDGRAGFYTKVGRLVTVSLSLGFTTYTGGSGAFRISGLPFTTISSSGSESAGGVLTERFVVASASYTYFTIRTNSNVSFLELMQSGSNVSWQGVPYGTGVTSSGTGKYLTAVLSYIV